MQAQGEHIIIRKPNKAKATDSGLVLPDGFDQKLSYGRIVSVGQACTGHELQIELKEGDIVAYQPQGVDDLEFGALVDADLCVAHISAVFLSMTEDDLNERKLPIPA